MSNVFDLGYKLASLDLGDFAAEIRNADTWTEHRARTVDREIRSRVLHMLSTHAALSDILSTQEQLQRSVNLASERLDALDRSWADRWRGILGVLSLRLEQLERRDEQAMLRRAHVRAILTALRDVGSAGLNQTAIAEHVQQTPQAISRLLRVLDDHGLIVRQAHGRSNQVILSDRGREVLASATASYDSCHGPAVPPSDLITNVHSLDQLDATGTLKERAPHALEQYRVASRASRVYIRQLWSVKVNFEVKQTRTSPKPPRQAHRVEVPSTARTGDDGAENATADTTGAGRSGSYNPA